MLQSLTIRNYALISNLEIDFPKGFSVITGETGAGKSIILGALSLILGQRADAKSIRQGEDKCLIEGVFDVSEYNLEQFFTENDLEYDAKTCIIRREIWTSGKSRAFVNDSPAGLNALKELGSFLIDIHSQHQNLLLADNRFQLQVLDVLAGNADLKKEYSAAYAKYSALNRQIAELKEDIARKRDEEEYLRFQFNQLDEAKLKPGEQAELEAEAETLSHIEEIKTGLYNIGKLLANDESGVLSALKEALNTAQSLARMYAPAAEIAERIQTAYLDMKDLAPEVENRQESLEFQPERMQEVAERLDLIYSLEQKHRVDAVEALIDLHATLDAQLGEISHSGETLEKLEKEAAAAYEKMALLADKLTETRKKSATMLEKKLVEHVSMLGMPSMRFAANISPKSSYGASGRDEATFLFSANKNVELHSVAQTASGGEISRLMLGVKALIAGATSLPAIIFDEIDVGVSGEIADKMGKILHDMGEQMQVIAISHLPQIAAKGDSQFLVYKKETKNTTETGIRLLNRDERITEIAKILSGAKLTEAAVENAKNLLEI
ncbi:MAG: DNA repair protein RecN [Dysgonamonadaceae bacterium]|jgi:DNA repair protein RecN (Recombination protein N)|nr:DNA repair protein RecN [Dysgonamonadaceae bacterium]